MVALSAQTGKSSTSFVYGEGEADFSLPHNVGEGFIPSQ